MSLADMTGRDEAPKPFEVLSTDEENALGAIRLAVAGIRERGPVADVAAIVRAVVEAGGSEESPAENGLRRLRLGSARFSVTVLPAEGGRVGVEFDPPPA